MHSVSLKNPIGWAARPSRPVAAHSPSQEPAPTRKAELAWLKEAAEDASLQPYFLRLRLPPGGPSEPAWEGLREFHLGQARKLASLQKAADWDPGVRPQQRRTALLTLVDRLGHHAVARNGEALVRTLNEPPGFASNFGTLLELLDEQSAGRPAPPDLLEDLRALRDLPEGHARLYRNFRARVRDPEAARRWLQARRVDPSRTEPLHELALRQTRDGAVNLLAAAALLPPGPWAEDKNEEVLAGAERLQGLCSRLTGFQPDSERRADVERMVAELREPEEPGLQALQRLGLLFDDLQPLADTGERIRSATQAIVSQVGRVEGSQRRARLEEFREALSVLGPLPRELGVDTIGRLPEAGRPGESLPETAVRLQQSFKALEGRLGPVLESEGFPPSTAREVMACVFSSGTFSPSPSGLSLVEGVVTRAAGRFNSISLQELAREAARRLRPDDTADGLLQGLEFEHFVTGSYKGLAKARTEIGKSVPDSRVLALASLLRLAGQSRQDALSQTVSLLRGRPGATLAELMDPPAAQVVLRGRPDQEEAALQAGQALLELTTRGGLEEEAARSVLARLLESSRRKDVENDTRAPGAPSCLRTVTELARLGVSGQKAGEVVLDLVDAGLETRLPWLTEMLKTVPQDLPRDAFASQAGALLAGLDGAALQGMAERIARANLLPASDPDQWRLQFLPAHPSSSATIEVVGDRVRVGSVSLPVRRF